MKSRYNAFAIWASLMAGIGSHHRMNIERKQTGGHRRRDHIPDEYDNYRLAFAQGRRERRALKRYENHAKCVANNPCYKGVAV